MRAYWSGWFKTGTAWTNASGYKNAEADSLIESTGVEGSPEKRIASFKRLQEIILEDLPSLPLLELRFFTMNPTTHSANLQDVVVQGDQVYSSLKHLWFSEDTAEK